MIKRILQVLLVILVVVSLGGVIAFFLPAKTTNEQRIFTTEEIANLKEISLNGNFTLNITTSDSKEIKCNISKIRKGYVSGDYGLVESKIEDNILYVNEGNKKDIVCIGGGITERIDIDIPKSYKNKLSISSKLSKINILNSNSKDIECDVKDSNITISLDDICGNITVNSHLGDIDLKLPKDEKFNLSAKSRLGKVTNNLASNVDSSITEKNINLSSSDSNITISGN
jgi:hypothetical protein